MKRRTKTSPSQTPLVRLRDVRKVYDTGKVRIDALQGISLDILPGEMVMVMGPSGCGKTTLLNCCSGLDEITSGLVEVEGVDITTMQDNARTDYRARHMGFIFQFYNLLPVLTAVENVELPLLVAGARPAEARQRALEMLDQVGLRNWQSHLPAELSGGQRQRVTIARALVNSPKIVWADEPTGDLDTATGTDIMDLMCRLNRDQGQTFVVVTHDPEVGARGSRMVTMRDGAIAHDVLLKPKDPRHAR